LKFKTVHYHYVPELLKKYAELMNKPEVTSVIDKGILSSDDAKTFISFIPDFLDYIRENNIEVEIPDISYEAEAFVDEAGYLSEWDRMIDNL